MCGEIRIWWGLSQTHWDTECKSELRSPETSGFVQEGHREGENWTELKCKMHGWEESDWIGSWRQARGIVRSTLSIILLLFASNLSGYYLYILFFLLHFCMKSHQISLLPEVQTCVCSLCPMGSWFGEMITGCWATFPWVWICSF